MPRIRTIKPEFWTDESLTECSMSARLLFIGMLNFSDDNGNQVKSPKRLKMQIFPADNIDVEPLLDELTTHGLLSEYSVSGKNYLHINGFLKHQKINRPTKSNIPLPNSVSAHESLTERSLLEEDKEEDKEKKSKKEIRANALDGFDQFWSTYNKKHDRAKCEKKWKKLNASEKQNIFKVLTEYVKSTPDKQFRKNPLTWLNGECWNDEIETGEPELSEFEKAVKRGKELGIEWQGYTVHTQDQFIAEVNNVVQ